MLYAFKRMLIFSTLATCFAALFLTCAYAQDRTLVRDGHGSGQYMILLDEGASDNEDATGEPPARKTMDPENSEDIYGWHKPTVRALVKRLERTYGVSALTMTSHALPAFSAYVPETTLARLRVDPAVSQIVPVLHGSTQFSAWFDQYSGSEIVPWGKIAIGTNDSISTTNRVYMIDGGAQAHDDLFLVFAPINPAYSSLAPQHANHVAGILGARMNNAGVRGINPNGVVVNVNRGLYDPEVASAFDWVLADAEQNGIYAVANISSNGPSFSAGGYLAKYMRRISNRVLIVQSAGNGLVDACTRAYSSTNTDDGILVVGGIDQYGQQGVPFDNTGVGPGWIVEPGSNYGPCVEIWGPSVQVWSTWSTSPTAIQLLSGTSMAAPHVAALAARYGSTSTTPVERENYIRYKRFPTGYNDLAGYPIYVPSYTQPLWGVIGSRLQASSVYADATLAGTSPWNLVDGLYLAGFWNSGHFAPAWVEFDLGHMSVITGIRLSPLQYPAGTVTHYVFAGSGPAPTTLVGIFNGDGASLEPFATAIGAQARYIRVFTATSPSWVGWREVEIYGY